MNEFQREIYKTIDKLTDKRLKQLGYDKTKRGKVMSVNGTKCTVQIDGEEYTCRLRRGIYIEPNDIVYVKFPQNNDADKYVDTVLGGNETPDYLVISAQEILDKIKTVDGAGSGLNADLLDGKHANEFATLDDLEDMDVDISGESIVANINASQSIIDDKNLSENVNDAIDKKHSHINKSTIDSIKQDDIDTWGTVVNKSDKIYVDNKLDDKVDKVEGKGLSEESYSTSEKSKLAGIETGANKYTHPDTHPANIIEQNSDNRFTTDVEKANWNAKETATGAQTKANVAESNAKTYTDNHIADNTKHISSNERNLWNTVEGKVDKIAGKQLSDESYTLIEKNKLSGVEVGANKYSHPSTHSLDIITETTTKKIMTSTERDKLAGISNNANNVESSLINGNIKIDNVEKDVYTHPSGTNPHGTTKSDVGLSNVENKSSATIRGEITSSNITGSLGYTPENSLNKGVANGYAPLDSNIKIPLSMLPDIAKQQTYVVEALGDRDNLIGLIMGEKCYVTSTGDSYIWDGDSWEILAKADWENVNLQWANIVGKPNSNVSDIDDATLKRHTHSNKSIIDTITQTLIDRWNSAWTHISDTIKHITSTERTKWNTVENKADITYVNTELNKKIDKIAGKQLSTEDFTTNMKDKLVNIEEGANKYTLPIASELLLGGIKIGANLTITEDGTLNALSGDDVSSFIIKQEIFIANEGQQVFNLTKGNYKPNTNTISVYLYGGKQPNTILNEISSTSFEISLPLKDGDIVIVEYIELSSATPYPIHGSDHLLDGYDPIPLATTSKEGLMSKGDKSKLDDIENGANKYVHPSTHSLDIITETTSKKILTVTERVKISEVDNKVDKIIGKGLSDENYTSTEKIKLSEIEVGANKYIHPVNHPASMITESSSQRFVSDSEKATWDTVISKADKDYVNTELDKKADTIDIPTKLSSFTKDINFDERYYTETEMNTLLATKVDNGRVLTDVPSNAKFTDTTYSNATTSLSGLMSGTDKNNLNTNTSARHTHTNKTTLDGLSDVSGKLKYNGQDIGVGDMKKTIYDADGDGKVDVSNDSEKLGGHPPDYYLSGVVTWGDFTKNLV